MLEDTIKTPRITEMQPWEFTVFICSVTQAYYSKTVYKNEMMHIKLEKMLPMFLAPVYQKMEFTTEALFEYDIK
jgi:hypothetical protein